MDAGSGGGAGAGGCRSHLPGHRLPRVHAELLRRSPWGWREGAVTSVGADGWITVECTPEPGAVRAWHHRDLRADLPVGAPVRVHERHGALGGPVGVLSLLIEGGLGAVLEPVDLDRWAAGTPAPVIDLREGATRERRSPQP